VILIAHPENRRLGTRFRVTPGAVLEIGRSQEAQISLPEVPSLSRNHARLQFADGRVSLEDLGSRNGTFVNDRSSKGSIELRSGDRFQVGAVHFKFLHERDVEHAYYEAIHEMVVRDGLTGVHNRRKFAEEANREVARAARHGRPLSLILVDIDHFKQVNDTHGHLAGDATLKQLATRIAGLVRAEEVFARIGGEEFAVLCPETDGDGAVVLAEKLRAACADQPLDCAGVTIRVTCSFGVAQLKPEMAKIEDLMRAADRALYQAKSLGRNRVSVAV
jgi:diguanylate cyclase (GGDEF)-like protein